MAGLICGIATIALGILSLILGLAQSLVFQRSLVFGWTVAEAAKAFGQ